MHTTRKKKYLLFLNIAKRRKWTLLFFVVGGIFIIYQPLFFLRGCLKTWKKVATISYTDTVQDQLMKLSRSHPNLPIQYWLNRSQNENAVFYSNSSCAALPNILELDYSNIYWQSLHTKKAQLQFYSAYLDTRSNQEFKKSVRVLTMINRIYTNSTLYCQIWFENVDSPAVVETNDYLYIWYEVWKSHYDGDFAPYILTCQIPKHLENKRPAAISIVETGCAIAKNFIKVIYEKATPMHKFAVCVKGLEFFNQDKSVRLVEWIEFLRLMGAHKLFFYELQTTKNVKKVLDYYKSIDIVDVRHLTLPNGQPNSPILQHLFIVNNLVKQSLDELIPYNDCFYRNIYKYEYVVLLDIDEMIVPVASKDWKTLIDAAIKNATEHGKENKFASYNARNAYFLDDFDFKERYPDIPPYMHMLQHVYRTRNFSDLFYYVKSFFDTQRVVAVHNHLPRYIFPNFEMTHSISTDVAQLNHYRKTCPGEVNCTAASIDPVKDTVIWRYKDDLISRTNAVLEQLNLFV